ncbi:MAG: hypothetical protein GY705_03595 [Bacteroidetes bacterium]|nr:hypothetical protein [Bacteroidota bacterium]
MKVFAALFLSLFFFVISVVAQENHSNNEFARAIGFTYSYGYNSRWLKADKGNEWIVIVKNEIEIPSNYFEVGLSWMTPLDDAWKLKIELVYASFNIATEEVDLFRISDNNIDPPGKISRKYHKRFLSPQISFYFYPLKNKKYFISSGLNYNIFDHGFIASSVSIKNRDSYERNEIRDGNGTSHAAFTFGTGYEFTLYRRWSMQIEPQFQYSLSSATDKFFKTYFYSAGISVGIFLGGTR